MPYSPLHHFFVPGLRVGWRTRGNQKTILQRTFICPTLEAESIDLASPEPELESNLRSFCVIYYFNFIPNARGDKDRSKTIANNSARPFGFWVTRHPFYKSSVIIAFLQEIQFSSTGDLTSILILSRLRVFERCVIR